MEDLGTGTTKYFNHALDANSLWASTLGVQLSGQRKIGRGNNRWVLACSSKNQQAEISKVTQLVTKNNNTINIKCRIPQSKTEGVIGPVSKEVSDDSLRAVIADSNNIKILSATRLKKRNGETSEMIKLIFETEILPMEVNLGSMTFKVHPFRPTVRQCGK
jgi:hypothetical protein